MILIKRKWRKIKNNWDENKNKIKGNWSRY